MYYSSRFRDRKKLKEILAAIGKSLADYPYWNEYIATQHTQNDYKYDGSYVSQIGVGFVLTARGRVLTLPESYAKWVTRKMQVKKRQVLLGIDEIFPQNFGEEQVRIPHRGEREETKRWRILKASELIPEKR